MLCKWFAHKSATLTSIQHTVGADFAFSRGFLPVNEKGMAGKVKSTIK